MSPASQPFLFSISFTTMVSGWDHSLISDKRLHAVLRIILSHPNFYYSILSFGSIIIYGPDIWINFFFFFFFCGCWVPHAYVRIEVWKKIRIACNFFCLNCNMFITIVRFNCLNRYSDSSKDVLRCELCENLS